MCVPMYRSSIASLRHHLHASKSPPWSREFPNWNLVDAIPSFPCSSMLTSCMQLRLQRERYTACRHALNMIAQHPEHEGGEEEDTSCTSNTLSFCRSVFCTRCGEACDAHIFIVARKSLTMIEGFIFRQGEIGQGARRILGRSTQCRIFGLENEIETYLSTKHMHSRYNSLQVRSKGGFALHTWCPRRWCCHFCTP